MIIITRKGIISKIKILSEARAMWLAGIIDSDGYIYFKPRPYCVDNIRIAITNNNLVFLNRIAEEMGGGLIHKKDDAPSGPVFDLYFRIQECKDLLPQIIPYLIIKQEKAIDALNRINDRKYLEGDD